MDFKNFVTKTQEFINCDVEDSKHIAFTVTANYVQYAGVVMTTALLNGSGNFSFHIFSTEFYENDIKNIQKTAKEFACNIFLHYIDDLFIRQWNNPGNFSYATYYRLIIPEFLKRYTDRFFYSDVDVCVLKDISSIWEFDISNVCAAVTEIQGKRHRNEWKRLGVKRYFAAGGMLINNILWNEYNITEKAIELVNSGIKYPYFDMDILNKVLENKVIFIDDKYQYQYSIAHAIDNEDMPTKIMIPEDTVIFHYTGSIKPWHKLAETFKVAAPFIEAAKLSFWNRINIVFPNSYKQYHKFARLAKKEGNFWDIVYWYYKYSKAKIIALIDL